MATLDDSPSLFSGKTWHEWAKHVPSVTLNDPGGKGPTEKPEKDSDSMRLNKEDMPLFGFCPARDEFYLVICEKCNQVIKPQAFRRHLEVRHGETAVLSTSKLLSHSSHQSHTVSPTKGSKPAFKSGPSVPTKASVKQPPPSISQSLQQKMGSSSHTKLKSEEKLKKNHMPVVKVERMPELAMKMATLPSHLIHHAETNVNIIKSPLTNGTVKSASNTSTPMPTPPTPSTPVSQVTVPVSVTLSVTTAAMTSTGTTTTASITTMAASSTSLTSTTSVTTATTTTSVISSSFSTKKFPHMDKIIPCKDREYDANKHCGVIIPEIGKACTRSLTCKTHALSLRRQVQGRRLPFDELLKEHKEAKEIYLKAKAEHTANVKAAKIAAAGGQPKSHNNVAALGRPLLANELQSHRELSSQAKIASHQLLQKTPPKPSVRSPNSLYHRPNPNSLHSPPLHIKEEPGGGYSGVSRLGGSPEGDGNDGNDYQYISYHPRPAAMCTFGGRHHSLGGSGGGCHMFSRKTDYLRASFLNLLEKHLNPPPPKKLCVESNLPKESNFISNSKDPYEFNMVDTTISATHGFNTVLNSANKGLVKPKPKSMSGGNRSKSKDSNTGSRSPGHSSSSSSNNSAVKRKRSGGSTGSATSPTSTSSVGIPTTSFATGVSTVNSQTTSNPYHAITIPNMNFSTTLSHFSANLTGKQPKNNLIKDLGFVVTGFTDPALNGQFLNLTSAQVTDFTRAQLSLDEKTLQNTQIVTGNAKTGYSAKLHNLQALPALQKNNLIATVPQNAFFMDATMQQGTVLAPVSIATSLSNPVMSVTNTNVSPTQPSPSTTPSPFRSRSASPQICSPLPNGVVPSPTDTNVLSAHRHSVAHKSHSHVSHKILQSQTSQPLLSATLPAPNTTQVCASQVLTARPLAQMQVKPRNIAVAKVGNKFSMQPVSMTIPFGVQPGLGAVARQQPTTHTLFITGEDPQKAELQLQAHHVSNSPSGMIS